MMRMRHQISDSSKSKQHSASVHVPNPYQTRSFGIQAQTEQPAPQSENIKLKAESGSQRFSQDLTNLLVFPPDTPQPEPITSRTPFWQNGQQQGQVQGEGIGWGQSKPNPIQRKCDPYEAQAQNSEKHLLDLAKPSITAAETQIQRYTEVSGGGKKYRIADDQSTAVQQDSICGSQALWAEAGKAQVASKQLAAAKSVIRLEEVGSPLNITKKGKGVKQLQQVKPKNVSNKTDGTGNSGMELWADCGKSARDVIGAGKGTGGGNPKAVYTAPSGKSATTAGTSVPASMKQEILLELIHAHEKKTGKKVLEQAKLKKMEERREEAAAKWKAANKAGKDKKTLDDLAAKYFYWNDEIKNLIVEGYHTKISDKERAALEKQAGINEWADPNVGEGYTISSGGADKPGNRTWNFHWAGVVMNSNDGSDRVSLENYAVGDASVENTEWVYQMYGSAKAAEVDASKKGQTFHEQHRDLHAQHGETPTTMKVKPK